LAPLEGVEVSGFVVGGAVDPATKEELTAPCNLLVQPRDAGGHSAELRQERLDEKAGRLDDVVQRPG
jgi:hypothetical protein